MKNPLDSLASTFDLDIELQKLKKKKTEKLIRHVRYEKIDNITITVGPRFDNEFIIYVHKEIEIQE